jgi:hypothetical protein
MDQKIKAQVVRIERKTFTISLNENPRGRFVRIMEVTAGNMSDAVVIPSSGVAEVVTVLQELMRFEPETGGGTDLNGDCFIPDRCGS